MPMPGLSTRSSIVAVLGMTAFAVCACGSAGGGRGRDFHTAKKVYALPSDKRIAAFDTLTVSQQYAVVKYGFTHVHPPDFYIIDAFARRGPASANYVKERLMQDTSDDATLLAMMLYRQMDALKSYDVKGDSVLASTMRKRCRAIADTTWRATCRRWCDELFGRL